MLIYISFLLLLFIECESQSQNPDYVRNVTEFIISRGYPCEDYTVVTADDYILSLQRIPYGRNENGTGSQKRPVVLLVPGYLTYGVIFVWNNANQSVVYILADAGYDVWIVNLRGTPPSKQHITLSNESKEYWKFCIDEFGKFDLPATIDYILNITGQTNLSIIGVSMGSAVILMMLSEFPEYNAKIKVAILWAQAAFVSNSRSPLCELAPVVDGGQILYESFGEYEFNLCNTMFGFLGETTCNTTVLQPVCAEAVYSVQGYDPANTNQSMLGVYYHHLCITSTSIFVGHQIVQFYETGDFAKCDLKSDNMKVYGQPTPPLYDLSKVTCAIVLITGLNDLLSTLPDAKILKAQLVSTPVVDYVVANPNWNHFDFAIAINATEELHNPYVLPILKIYN